MSKTAMTQNEVEEFLEEQLNDIGTPDPGDVMLLMKPEGATEEQWKVALDEFGVIPNDED